VAPNRFPSTTPALARAAGALAILTTLVLGGCSDDSTSPATVSPAPADPARAPARVVNDPVDGAAFSDANRFYFDVGGHSPDEILAMLTRADELAASGTPTDPIEIVMVLHGPDLKLFTDEAPAGHADIGALASRLDAGGVIDFKACLRSVEEQGLSESSFPAYIEMVPFAPDELARLKSEGFIEL